jgi:hypothetical protein
LSQPVSDDRFASPPRLDDGGTETGDAGAPRVHLEFADADQVRSFFESARKETGFLLPLPESPRLYEVVSVRALCGEAFELEVDARVIQSFERPGPDGARYQVAFQLEGWNPGRNAELMRKLSRIPAEGAASRGAAAGEGEVTGSSPMFRIKAMNPNERMRLALKAGRTERSILVRDTSARVLMGLLGNPRLDGEDVLHIVRSTHANAAILKRVAEDRRWTQNPEIRNAVVRNPKTPTPLALRLLETLRTPDLQVLAKAGQAKEALRRAAVRLYLKRIQRK